MLNLIKCELLKLKHSKMVHISILGVMSTPFMMFVEALQTHFKYPERIFTLSDIYDNSLLYMMLLTNMMIYVVIAAYLFSREYSENTLKTILPIPISRSKLLFGKFCTLFFWIIMLTFVTWSGILILSGLYHIIFNLEGYSMLIALSWLFKYLIASILMYITISPFAYISQKTKGFVTPMIISAVVVMLNAALSNNDIGALYPWTANYFLIMDKLESTGYPILLSIGLIAILTIIGFLMTFHHFKNEDLK